MRRAVNPRIRPTVPALSRGPSSVTCRAVVLWRPADGDPRRQPCGCLTRTCRHNSESLVRKLNFTEDYIGGPLPPPLPLAPHEHSGGMDRMGGSTFVSKYYNVDMGEMENFLQRKDLAYRETNSHLIVRECPFCPKPTYAKQDNMYKLYITRDGGAWFCHRCGEKGSWFDFKRKLGGSLLAGLAPAISPTQHEHASGGWNTTASLPPPPNRRRPRGKEASLADLRGRLRAAQQTLMDNPEPHLVRQWLRGRGPGQRGLSASVLRKYGVGCATFAFANEQNYFEDAECVVFPWFTMEGNKWVPTRMKVRAMEHKAWQRLHPSGGGWGLFGLHTVGQEEKEVVITEGEFDAMAVAQATGRPAVSLPNGCRSLPVEVLPLLERFERIYLWMDADAPGVEGAEKFAKKLGVRRTYIVRPSPEMSADPPKDANDALLRGEDLEAMIQGATLMPDHRIVRFADLKDTVLHGMRNADKCIGVMTKSFARLMSLLKGFRPGELTVLTGPTGAGKTTFLSQLSIDLAAQGVNTLWGSFEVPNTRLMDKMLRQFHAAPLHVGDSRAMEALAERFGQLPLLFMRFQGSTNLDEVIDAMEYAAYVHDTNLVILDNLQFMLSMTQRGGGGGGNKASMDRFYQMDVAVEKFRRFATEKNVHVVLVVHPRKENDAMRLQLSSISGTAKATQDADNVLVLQRHAGLHYLDLKKNRFDGELGVVAMDFDRGSSRLVEAPHKLKSLTGALTARAWERKEQQPQVDESAGV